MKGYRLLRKDRVWRQRGGVTLHVSEPAGVHGALLGDGLAATLELLGLD